MLALHHKSKTDISTSRSRNHCWKIFYCRKRCKLIQDIVYSYWQCSIISFLGLKDNIFITLFNKQSNKFMICCFFIRSYNKNSRFFSPTLSRSILFDESRLSNWGCFVKQRIFSSKVDNIDA